MPNLLAMSFEGQLAPSFRLHCLEPGRTLPDGSHQLLADHMIDAKLAEGPGPWERRDWCR